jgi:hypothetical protein
MILATVGATRCAPWEDGMKPSATYPLRAGTLVVAAALGAGLLAGCAQATRYVVVTGDRPLAAPQAVDRRPIWVADEDAAPVTGLMGLATAADVRQYGATRGGEGLVIEALLFAMVSGDWAGAQALLESRGGEVPAYLRLLVAADVTAETIRASSQAEVLRLYQQAYDAQATAAGRSVVELRVRQLRYGR